MKGRISFDEQIVAVVVVSWVFILESSLKYIAMAVMGRGGIRLKTEFGWSVVFIQWQL